MTGIPSAPRASKWCGESGRYERPVPLTTGTLTEKGHVMATSQSTSAHAPNQPYVRFAVLNRWVLIDATEWSRVNAHAWTMSSHGYVTRCGGVYLHRFLTAPPDGLVVDHANGNKLDNRLCNLRVCEHHLNLANTPNLSRGVSGHKNIYPVGSKWGVFICTNRDGRNHKQHIGTFDTLGEAILVRDRARAAEWGEFAQPSTDVIDFSQVPIVYARRNTVSGYRGVCWNPRKKKWTVRVMVGTRARYFGTYDDPQEAARVYDKAAIGLLGDNARLNFPRG